MMSINGQPVDTVSAGLAAGLTPKLYDFVDFVSAPVLGMLVGSLMIVFVVWLTLRSIAGE